MGSRAGKESRGPAGEERKDTADGVVRNKPGPADPETRRREIAKRVAEREPKRPAAPKPAAKPNNAGGEPTGTLNPFINVKQRPGRINKAVDDAS